MDLIPESSTVAFQAFFLFADRITFLDDNFRDDRECGLKLGIMELRHSQSFLLVIIDGVISEGMKREIVEVSRMGIPGRIVAMTHEEIRQRKAGDKARELGEMERRRAKVRRK